MLNNYKLCIVVPCYNESEILEESNQQLLQVLNNLIKDNLISEDSKILYVDDGSNDTTYSMIKHYQYNNSNKILGLKLSRNQGHQNAVYAGLMYAKEHFDITVSVDADLQDDLSIIREFVLKHHDGYDIVYGVRKRRTSDGFFKRNTALAFYKLMAIMGVELIYNHADYRLMSNRALCSLAEFQEVNLFLRGIIPLLGYNATSVYYNRLDRKAGDSKYTISKMFNLAFDGITSFSIRPIRFIGSIGIMVTMTGILYMIYAIIQKLTNHTTTGWTSVIISIWIIGGFQITAIGLIGEDIGRIYKEVKHRPKYFIEQILDEHHNN